MMLKLSLIIPVYNGEYHIRNTLVSIARQTVMPHEVILVDNNSTDRTVEITREFDFVTVITEKKQGRAHARNAGFNHATGDLLARIDEDSMLDPDWVENAIQAFEADRELGGATGIGSTPMLPFVSWPKWSLYSKTYYWNSQAFFGCVTMWGATTVIRAQAWQDVKDTVTNDDAKVHEDQDISLCLLAKGYSLQVLDNLRITTNGQSFRYFPKFTYYTRLRRRTRSLHVAKGTLPVTKKYQIPLRTLLWQHVLSLPAVIVGSVFGTLLFPLDYLAVRVLKIPNWFN